MFRQAPNPGMPFSGWCFVSGKEEKDDDLDLYFVESLLEADASVEPFLSEPVGTRFRRNHEGIFERVTCKVLDDDPLA
jgi:hypothetical protein